jgi:L-rhamnose 1-dehydrogenase
MLGHSDRSSVDDILTLRHQIEVLGRKVADQAGDIGDPDTGAALIAMAVERLGGVDVFISNAGIVLSTLFWTCRTRRITAR